MEWMQRVVQQDLPKIDTSTWRRIDWSRINASNYMVIFNHNTRLKLQALGVDDLLELGTQVLTALYLAATAHGSVRQIRKYSGEDYIVHPIDVCRILIRNGFDYEDVLAAALMHDVVEDTPVTEELLDAIFPAEVVKIVMGLTDVSKPSDGNRRVRKALDREHSAKGCFHTQSAKYADCISNARSIRQDDPDFWVKFRHEIQALLAVADKGDVGLYSEVMYEISLPAGVMTA